MGMITTDWYVMRPFRMWANAVSYMSAGCITCLQNNLSLLTGEALQYTVHR